MKRVLKISNKIEEYIIITTLPTMLLFVFLAVIFRYFKLGSLTWADEAARFLMIWLVFAGISLGIKVNCHLGLSFFVTRFSERKQEIFYYIQTFLIFLFGALIAYYTIIILQTQIRNPQLSPSLGIPMWWVYSSMVFGSIMIIIRTLQRLFININKKREVTEK